MKQASQRQQMATTNRSSGRAWLDDGGYDFFRLTPDVPGLSSPPEFAETLSSIAESYLRVFRGTSLPSLQRSGGREDMVSMGRCPSEEVIALLGLGSIIMLGVILADSIEL